MVGETGDVVDPRNAVGGTLVQRTSRLLLLTVALGGTLSAPAAAQDPIPGRSPGDAPLRIAVGPFTNITGAEDDAWVGAGIAETLRVELELGTGRWTVYSCDLTKEYVAINGDYRS